jgi:glycosyltransferase involved in cell wall biosynthesis
MPRELVSVVIPCYNQAQFLARAVESALAQTHPPLDVIVVDDGSTDDTLQVARGYPVRIISQRRQGVCAAVNNGVAACAGDFFLRLDADDELEPTYVEETLAALRGSPGAAFAYTEFVHFGARTGSYPVEEFSAESLAERNYVHASALMRTSAFRAVGGYDPRMTNARCEDWDLWLAFADRGFAGILVRRPLLRYRAHRAASRNTLAWTSGQFWARNLRMVARLQDNHPVLFAPRALVHRLARLPRRVLKHEVSARFAVLLVGMYGVMLLRYTLKLGARRVASAT